MVETTERQRRAVDVALAAVVQHDVEDDPDPRGMQRLDGGADLLKATRRQPRVRRHQAHRIVAPAIAETQGRKVALVDPGGERHEFNGIDTQPLQMVDDRRLAQCGDRAAQLRRHIGVKPREGLDRHLVDELRAMRREGLRVSGVMAGDGLGHQPRRVDAALHELRVMREGRADAGRIGIEQEFRRIEAVALIGRPRPLGAEPILHTGAKARHMAEVHVAQPRGKRVARHLLSVLEERDENARGMARDDRHIGTVPCERDAGRRRQGVQVITVGAERPVWRSIPASERDSAMSGASASCVSIAWRLASGS